MGFESPQPRQKSIDEIFAGLPSVPEQNGHAKIREYVIDSVTCRISETSTNTWNVYQDGVLYAVTKQHDGSLIAAMQSNVDLAPGAIAEGKVRAISAVTAHLAQPLQL